MPSMPSPLSDTAGAAPGGNQPPFVPPFPLSHSHSLPSGGGAVDTPLLGGDLSQQSQLQPAAHTTPPNPHGDRGPAAHPLTARPPPSLPFQRSRTIESDPGYSRHSSRLRTSRIGTSTAASTAGSSSRRTSSASFVHPSTLVAGRHRHMHQHHTRSRSNVPSSSASTGSMAHDADLPDVFSPSRIRSLHTLANMNRSWTDQELWAEVERDMRRDGRGQSDTEDEAAAMGIALVRSPTASPVLLPDVPLGAGAKCAISPAATSGYTPFAYSSESETESSMRSSLRRRADQVHLPAEEHVQIGPQHHTASAPATQAPASGGDGNAGDGEENDEADIDIAAELESLSDRNRLLRKHLTLKRELAGISELRKALFLFLEAPSTLASKCYAMFHFLLVILSVILVCIETFPQFYDQVPSWKPLDLGICVYFTLDLLARFYAVPNRLKYCTRILTILDVATLVPYWLDAVGASSSDNSLFVMRILRIGRIFQLFRHMRSSPLINITVQSVERSKEAFFLVVLYAALGILIASSAMYMLERGSWDHEQRAWIRTKPFGTEDEVSPFQSIMDGFYWAVVTITTTGYGDILPSTNGGRFIAGFTMIIGVSIIALPVSIIGAHFMAEWIEYQRIRLKSKAQPLGTALDAQGNPILGAAMAPAPASLSKQAQIHQLQERRDALMTLVQQAQDALNDVAPTETYARYLRMKEKYQVALARVNKLQLRANELQEQVVDLKKLYGSTTLSAGGGGDSGAGGGGGLGHLPFTRTMSRTTTWFRDWATGGEPYRNRDAPSGERPTSASGGGNRTLGGLFRHLSSADVNDETPGRHTPAGIPLTSRTMSMPVNASRSSPRRRPSRRFLSNLFHKGKRSPSPRSRSTRTSSSESESTDDDLVTTGLHHAHLPMHKISKSQIRRIDTAPILLGSNNSDAAGPSSAPAQAQTAMAQALPPWMMHELPTNPQLTVTSTMSAPMGGGQGLRVQFPDHEPLASQRRPGEDGVLAGESLGMQAVEPLANAGAVKDGTVLDRG